MPVAKHGNRAATSQAGSADVTVTDSTFSGNAGGITTALGGDVTVTGSTFSDNTGSGGIDVGKYGTLTMADSTVSGNSAQVGGGISGGYPSTVTITDSTVSGNTATQDGGGIWNYLNGDLSVTDSTVSGNSAGGDGGGIWNGFHGAVTVVNSTVSGNTAMQNGGGIYSVSTLTALLATIVADSTSGHDCSGAVIGRWNLDDDGSCGFTATNHGQSGVNPELGPLQNNGGPTETQAPAIGSPALNRIPLGTKENGTILCPGTDQRGVARPQGTKCDIGAVEPVLRPPAITSPNHAAATVGAPFSFTVTTVGTPTPSITEKGTLPVHVTFVHHGSGTAVISGEPTTTGVYHLKITATFGQVRTRYTVIQAFTLTARRVPLHRRPEGAETR